MVFAGLNALPLLGTDQRDGNLCRMAKKRDPGLFITGTDTGVGKTYVAALIAKALVASGKRVGVYKPVASGCRREAGRLVCDDAITLWQAAGMPGELAAVCPQFFEPPLAPHLAARAEGKQIDAALLRSGVDYWTTRSEVVLVEGAGGLMSPLGDDDYVAELAYDLGYRLIVVAPNKLGVINQTLQTLITAATFRNGLDVAGVVLNEPSSANDASTLTNFQELDSRCVPRLLAHVRFGQEAIDANVDWMALARR
jgi:dethiobiotin synthetase